MSPVGFLLAKMALFSQWAGRETSGWRDAERNEEVGGVPLSAHRFFLGSDFVPHPPTRDPHFEITARRLGLLALWEGDHYHLQPLDWPAG